MKKSEIQKEARRYALDFINKNRATVGKPALRCISPLWWRIHGPEFVKATEERAKADGKVV